MKGGHASSGPPPDPNALRRERDQGDWTTLPTAGRDGELPEWPLTAASERELVLWSRLWAKPQAIMWERYDLVDQVALYVRNFVQAEKIGAAVNRGTLVRQMADSLGLTTPGLRYNRWHIGPKLGVNPPPADDAPTASKSNTAPAKRSGGSRTRLTVVPSETGG